MSSLPHHYYTPFPAAPASSSSPPHTSSTPPHTASSSAHHLTNHHHHHRTPSHPSNASSRNSSHSSRRRRSSSRTRHHHTQPQPHPHSHSHKRSPSRSRSRSHSHSHVRSHAPTRSYSYSTSTSTSGSSYTSSSYSSYSGSSSSSSPASSRLGLNPHSRSSFATSATDAYANQALSSSRGYRGDANGPNFSSTKASSRLFGHLPHLDELFRSYLEMDLERAPLDELGRCAQELTEMLSSLELRRNEFLFDHSIAEDSDLMIYHNRLELLLYHKLKVEEAIVFKYSRSRAAAKNRERLAYLEKKSRPLAFEEKVAPASSPAVTVEGLKEQMDSKGPPPLDASQVVFSTRDPNTYLGQGVLGKVYVGKVAVKSVVVQVCKFNSAEEKKALLHHVHLMSNVFHPNVVLFMGSVQEEKRTLIVTEYIPEDLRSFLFSPKGSQVSSYTRLQLLSDIALGLVWLHELGIIHGNLRPENIRIQTSQHQLRRPARAKLCDFSLAQISKLQRSKQVKRTERRKREKERVSKRSGTEQNGEAIGGGGGVDGSGGAVSLRASTGMPPLRSSSGLIVPPKISFTPDLLWKSPRELANPTDEPSKGDDIYSFALLLWETLSQAHVYAGYDQYDNFFEDVVIEGVRPPIDQRWPPSVRWLLEACWSEPQTPSPSPSPSSSSTSRPHSPSNTVSKQLLMPEVLFRLGETTIDVVLDEEPCRQFWKSNFLQPNAEVAAEVPFDSFIDALVSYSHVRDSSKFMTVSRFLVDPNDSGSTLSTATPETRTISMQSFSQVVHCFGYFFLPGVALGYLKKLDRVASTPWFHGAIDIETAKARLQGRPVGTFLVRTSSTYPRYPFTVSILNATPQGKLFHTHKRVKVKFTPEGESSYVILREDTQTVERFPTLHQLVSFMKEHFQLVSVCPREVIPTTGGYVDV